MHLIRHYLNLFWRWKIFIVIAGPIGAAGALFYLFTFQANNPELPATAMIGLEKTSSIIEVAQSNDSRTELMHSRGFLREVVTDLSLRLHLKDYSRDQIFESVSVDSFAAEGTYEFIIDREKSDEYRITFTNKRQGLEDRAIQSGRISMLSGLHSSGLDLQFTADFLRQPHDFSFNILNMRVAVEILMKKMVVKGPSPRYNRKHIEVSVLGTDYQLATQIVNRVADQFVQRNLDMRKRKTQRTTEALNKQLRTAERELAQAENALKQFRSSNPTVGLSQGAQQTLTELTQLETFGDQTEDVLEKAEELNGRFSGSIGEDRIQLISEILLFLQSKGTLTAQILQSKFSSLVAQRQAEQNQMYPGHPKVKEIETQIDDVAQKAHAELLSYISKTRKDRTSRSSTITELNQRLRSLPEKEMRLAELQRRQQINSDIYSSVLSRLNQSKVADAVELAEVYVMDYAVPPIPPPVNSMQFFGIALLVGIGLAFAPVVLFDQLDKTVRTGMDLQKMVSIPVMESIPFFEEVNRDKQEEKKNSRKNKQKEPKLNRGRFKKNPVGTETIIENTPEVHTDQKGAHAQAEQTTASNDTERRLVQYTHPQPHPSLIVCDKGNYYGVEILKSLRAKIMMGLHGQQRRSIAFTSLDVGAGKSTTAANLAVLFAQQGMKTLLVDADMRRGVQHEFYRYTSVPGLSDFLAYNWPITSQTLAQLIRPTPFRGLWMIPCGSFTRRASELLGGGKMQALMNGLMGIYDMVIFDTPPFGAAIDPVLIHEIVSKYVLVARAGGTNIIDMKRKLSEFGMVEEKVMGIVLNQALLDQKMAYYRDSRYYSARAS